MNAGLWLEDPDVDTITRVEEPFRVTGMTPGYITLAPGTWSPFNSQNTAVSMELLPFLFLVVAGDELRGQRQSLRNFRYDDIWMSYFARVAIDQMGDLVTYGEPVVTQRRNPHDLLTDLDRELGPMLLTEDLIELLRALALTATNYRDLHTELLEQLRAGIASRTQLDPRERAFLEGIVDRMQVWGEACASFRP